MAAEPGPEQRALAAALTALWKRRGRPSMRLVADWSDGQVSHSTVSSALNGTQTPRWDKMLTIVRALDGQPEDFKALWGAAYQQVQDARPRLPAVERSAAQRETAEAIRDHAAALRDHADALRYLADAIRSHQQPQNGATS